MMAEMFKKGQIVPKRLGHVTFEDEKTRHRLVFGADTMVEGHLFTAVGDGPCFYFKAIERRMNNGTFKKSQVLITDIHFRCPTPF